MTPKKNLTGPQIRKARESKSLTERDLSDLCRKNDVELSPEEIEEIEAQSREVSDFELIALAEALEVSGTLLLFGDGPLPWEKA